MIPRLKPFIGSEEILALVASFPDATARFERAFAQQFNTAHAVAFSYGRSALWAFLE